ncbi:hypothetical protein [Lysobacter sp. GCM10012299]|uniref:hypothetical protein n=1 Tax=Lysobacter sp. GCM10012299 TaxID=3317333 RepID=UPI00360E7002
MTTLLRFQGQDPDDLFEPLGSNAPDPQDAGVLIHGQDARARYAPVALGAPIAFETRRVSKGRDWRDWFAAKGSVSLALAGVDGRWVGVGDAALTNQPTVTATVSFQIRSYGDWLFTGGNSHGAITISPPASGVWLPAGGVAGDYEVQFDVVHTGEGDVANGAPVWQDCSSSHGASLTLPTLSAANAYEREGELSVRTRIRLKTTQQVVSDSTCVLSAVTIGYA